ncbi:MAG: Rab family GTPase, partial [Candidatus Thorarchaeota archaeon]
MVATILDRIREKYKKIIVGGEGGAGRTTLLCRYVNGYFYTETKMTIGVQFFTKDLKFKEKSYNFIFWDFAGQERWRFFQEDFCKGADGAILAFDLTRPLTIESIDEWVSFLRRWNQNLPIILVGMKLDLDEMKLIPDEICREIVKENNLSNYFPVSCKT